MKKFVSYYRVSTEKQGQSGLGLEAQKFSVENYVKSVGGEIIASFTEIVSGGMKERISVSNNLSVEKLLAKRPVLAEALQYCQKHDATLVVKEAARLTRYSLLMDFLIASKIPFICADSPNDEPLIIRIKTALHEEELLKISERTKAALKAKKAQGYKLGSPAKPKPAALEKAVAKRKAEAAASKENRQAIHTILNLKKDGKTFRQIVDTLNHLGFLTSQGKPFGVSTVHMLYKRAMEQQPALKIWKRFNDLLNDNSEIAVLACQWCDIQLEKLPESQWLQWARDRFDIDTLDRLDNIGNFNLTRFYEAYEEKYPETEVDFGELLQCITEWCATFYFLNGGEMTPAEKRLAEKMQAESGYAPAREKENPDTSSDKIQLELEDGVAYISKKSGWVLSQF